MSEQRPRTVLILGIVAGVLAVAVAITLAIALTRSGAPAPTESSDPPAAPSTPSTPVAPGPEESASPGDAEPAEVELGAGGLTLVDAAGEELLAWGWSDDAQTAVAALTEAFGAAPTERVEAGNGTTYPDYTVYQWSGFALYDMVPLPGGPTRDEFSQPSYLRYTANTVGPIAITAEFGLEIGMPVTEVTALQPDAEEDRGGGTRFVFAADRSAHAGTPTYSVIADTDGEGVALGAILYFYYAG